MYDVIVIGGGPGGYAAAIRASQLGGKVGLVEAADIGGTCVNRGCMPTKVWLHAANMLYWIRRADEFGIKAFVKELDLPSLVTRRIGISSDTRMGMEGILRNNGVELIRGMAVLKSPNGVDVEGTIFNAKKIILATGSCLDIPEIPGLEEIALTTDQVLEMEKVPSSVLVCGAGPIELEMATLLNTFGCKVYLVAGNDGILPREDRTPRQWVTNGLKQQGVELLRRHTLKSLRKSKGGYEAILSGPEDRTIDVERVLVASRKPNISHLGLKQIGVRLNEDGGIQVNDRLKTSVEGLYAIGDATGGWMLAHASSSMGITAAENAMGKNEAFPSHLIPRGIWTFPEIGAVGLTEREVKKKGVDIEIGDFPYSIDGLAMARNQMEGSVKIISDSRYGEILGVHIVGACATELVGEAVLAMQLEATVQELTMSIRVHPTFSESVVDSARDALNWALYLPKH